MLKITGLTLCLVATTVSAEIYQWKDEKGVTHYGDKAPEEIKKSRSLDIQKNYSQPEERSTSEPARSEERQEKNNNYTRHLQVQNTSADWNTCADTKRRAVTAEKYHSQNAENLNEWLWKNCNGYSNELRKIEQEMM